MGFTKNYLFITLSVRTAIRTGVLYLELISSEHRTLVNDVWFTSQSVEVCPAVLLTPPVIFATIAVQVLKAWVICFELFKIFTKIIFHITKLPLLALEVHWNPFSVQALSGSAVLFKLLLPQK